MPLITKPYLNFTALKISWSVSRGKDTYGYNICRMDDEATGKRYRCMGGGYDMIGTVFGEWLADNFQDELLKIKNDAHSCLYETDDNNFRRANFTNGLYGMSLVTTLTTEKIAIDGGCGISSMIKIANAIGLEVNYMPTKKGDTKGFYVSMKR